MHLILELTPDIERALTEQADHRGTTPELLALDVLRQRFRIALGTRQEEPKNSPGSLADLLEDHVGVLSSSEHVPGGAGMSQDGGRKLTEALVEKRRQKRL